MWIGRKEYKFLKENAEKNINAECEILKAKDELIQSVARVMVEFSAVLEERDILREKINELQSPLYHKKELRYAEECEGCNIKGAYTSMCEENLREGHCQYFKYKD